MAFLQMNYHSDALKMGVSVNVILPESAKTVIGISAEGGGSYKTLYLLHGLSDDHTIWMRRTSIERYASRYGIAVVMPSVGRSWYNDTDYGQKFFEFVSRELPRVCRGFFRGMSDKREDNFIAGLSMGGYGALKTALTYPESFQACASLSGALDVVSRSFGFTPERWRDFFGAGFSRPEELPGSNKDIFTVVKNMKGDGKEPPRIFMWCGTEDSLLSHNRSFDKLLSELDIPHEYRESRGNHSWDCWDEHIKDVLEFFFGKK